MRVVLDTNVLVSGLLSPFGPPGDIVRLITTGTVRVCYDARILGEYRQVLLRPAFSFSQAQVESLLAQLEADGELVTARPLPESLPDPDDEVFLAVALASQAHCLVTGNLRHYPAPPRSAGRFPKEFSGVVPENGCVGRFVIAQHAEQESSNRVAKTLSVRKTSRNS